MLTSLLAITALAATPDPQALADSVSMDLLDYEAFTIDESDGTSTDILYMTLRSGNRAEVVFLNTSQSCDSSDSACMGGYPGFFRAKHVVTEEGRAVSRTFWSRDRIDPGGETMVRRMDIDETLSVENGEIDYQATFSQGDTILHSGSIVRDESDIISSNSSSSATGFAPISNYNGKWIISTPIRFDVTVAIINPPASGVGYPRTTFPEDVSEQWCIDQAEMAFEQAALRRGFAGPADQAAANGYDYLSEAFDEESREWFHKHDVAHINGWLEECFDAVPPNESPQPPDIDAPWLPDDWDIADYQTCFLCTAMIVEGTDLTGWDEDGNLFAFSYTGEPICTDWEPAMGQDTTGDGFCD